MDTLKAAWEVRAGLIPGQDMAEYSEAWLYTSADWQSDGERRGPLYHDKAAKAHAYAMKLEAGGLNHVRVEYLWV